MSVNCGSRLKCWDYSLHYTYTVWPTIHPSCRCAATDNTATPAHNAPAVVMKQAPTLTGVALQYHCSFSKFLQHGGSSFFSFIILIYFLYFSSSCSFFLRTICVHASPLSININSLTVKTQTNFFTFKPFAIYI